MITNAIRIHKQGGPEEMKWEETELPKIQEGDVLIKHTAIGLNYIDTYHRSGLYPMPVPLTLGIEGAGVVEEIGENVKYWARPDIINRIKEGSIKAYFNSNVKKITEEDILIRSPEKEFSIKNDFILAMTGYQPNFKLLEDLGVNFKSDEYRTPVYNEKTMESNVKGVYLAGVVCGGLKTNKWFIENSREHAPKIIQNIFKG